MATAKKICRVCGKEYEACHTLRQNAGVFRWQEVACSPECGTKYLAQIRASRGLASAKPTVHSATAIEENAKGLSEYQNKPSQNNGFRYERKSKTFNTNSEDSNNK